MQVSINPKIVDYLVKKTGLAEGTIRKNISLIKSDYPSCTSNAAAQIFAKSRGFSLMQKLSQDDKITLSNIEFKKQKFVVNQKKSIKKEKTIKIFDYKTDDYFKKGHIEEINKAYTKGCYTSVHILARKIIENLIREILSTKYPPEKKVNKELYFDISQNRFKDFSVILKNLYDKRHDFDPEKIKIIERLNQKASKFKKDSNDATHSWYHLINNKKEIDDLDIQLIIELIKKLEI